MKRLMISGLAGGRSAPGRNHHAAVALAFADRPVGAADMASLQQFRIAAGADKLPTRNSRICPWSFDRHKALSERPIPGDAASG